MKPIEKQAMFSRIEYFLKAKRRIADTNFPKFRLPFHWYIVQQTMEQHRFYMGISYTNSSLLTSSDVFIYIY